MDRPVRLSVAGLTLALVDRVQALGPEWDAVFAAGPGAQSRRGWFAATERAALPPGARACYMALSGAAGPLAVLPMRLDQGRLGSLTTPYTVLFQPLLAPAADPLAAGQAFGRQLRRWPHVVLDALDPAWPGLEPFLKGVRRAGLRTSRFDQFGNWHEPLAGRDWPAYLAARPGPLRETIRRKGRLAARDAAIRFEIVSSATGLPGAIAAYEAVYGRSWKEPEPFPAFTGVLLRGLAAEGGLRLGVMWQGVQPIAAQYWTVDWMGAQGIATVLKLAHDDAAKALSPGTLLTAHMIRALIEEGVTELDFGRGDDPYKQHWTTARRQRVGVLVANPLRPAGFAILLRQWCGAALRRLRSPYHR